MTWKQKSIVNWLKLGDRNTQFFQITTNYRLKKNLLGSVKVNGRLLVRPKEIKDAAMEYFKNIFLDENEERPRLRGDFTRILKLEVSGLIEKHFKLGEIEAVVRSCKNSRAPGLDGFNFSFIKKS